MPHPADIPRGRSPGPRWCTPLDGPDTPIMLVFSSHVPCKIVLYSTAPKARQVETHTGWHHLRQALRGWEDVALERKVQFSI